MLDTKSLYTQASPPAYLIRVHLLVTPVMVISSPRVRVPRMALFLVPAFSRTLTFFTFLVS